MRSLTSGAGPFLPNNDVRPLCLVHYQTRHTGDLFIANVGGSSMEPQIPRWSYCLFRMLQAGGFDAKILLVMRQQDGDTTYTVKRCTMVNGNYVLSSNNKDFRPFSAEEGDVPIAEYLETIGPTLPRTEQPVWPVWEEPA